MRHETIARNYAEVLFDLGEKSGRTALYADLLDAVAGGIAAAPTVQAVLMSPRVTKPQKTAILAGALPDAPRDFVLFLGAVVRRGRQGLFQEMAQAYLDLVDLKLNRVRAAVTVARPADEALRKTIAARLTEVVGKQVLPRFTEDPSILGGVVVRVGDRVFDGSVKRRMTLLRRALLAR
ncbi:MAG: ATP synthase F1 subunit delta [Gemmatimonadetes bacterium]|nr:ATP synthase F1 subunit delta [Gemmatimonadota bacterium]MBK6780267.1 ATP synthase F1 subunit delta [Gemmatimonadota bacterium]MBK7351008.1 ATP synthase F1 subunit delta [Gemmatimonadota bacterium]MBK7714983.1 ATP synthase F1 subunit delta [Gemmatimonadota bacterium]MBK7786168.1 ATP synthase F1 subunit delta [Gemmatimonadota bacterium]